MKLWIVKRRAPLGRGDRLVRVERTVAMAETAEAAIGLAKGDHPDATTHEGIMYSITFLSGTWSAEEIEGPAAVQLGTSYSDPTPIELGERAVRTTRKRAK